MNIQTKITPTTTTLDRLRPGQEYPDGNINARLTYTEAEIDELAASLMPNQDGQLRPFLVATHPKKQDVFFVFGGGRRRIAYERLIGRGDLPKDHPIEINVFGNIGVEEALSKSLADNQAVPMHPADQAATFARLAKDRSPEDIAKERGMTARAVQQSVALGTALAPEIIVAWREGKLTREEVQVFTINNDFDAQVKALNDSWQWQHGRGIDLRDIRRKLTRNKEPEMKRLLGFVGAETARAAGVEVTEDFFGQGGVVKDMKPLRKLAKEKMETLAIGLADNGWSWVETSLDEAPRMHHGYSEVSVKPEFTETEKTRLADIKAEIKRIQDSDDDDAYDREEQLDDEKEAIERAGRLRAFTEKHKAKSGVLVHLSAAGQPVIAAGLIKKEEPKKTATASSAKPTAKPESPKVPDINREVEEHIEDIQDEALAELIAAKPKEAFALFLAGLVHCDWRGPVEWRDLDQVVEDLGIIPGKDFAASFATLKKLPIDKLAAKLAQLVAKVTHVAGYLGGEKDAQAIVDLVGEKNLQAGLSKRFDAKAYVAGASKQHLLAILAETVGPEQIKAHRDSSEADLRAPAGTAIRSTGWLPPQLRTRVYAGPSAKKKGK